jgi:hypothetical protein
LLNVLLQIANKLGLSNKKKLLCNLYFLKIWKAGPDRGPWYWARYEDVWGSGNITPYNNPGISCRSLLCPAHFIPMKGLPVPVDDITARHSGENIIPIPAINRTSDIHPMVYSLYWLI